MSNFPNAGENISQPSASQTRDAPSRNKKIHRKTSVGNTTLEEIEETQKMLGLWWKHLKQRQTTSSHPRKLNCSTGVPDKNALEQTSPNVGSETFSLRLPPCLKIPKPTAQGKTSVDSNTRDWAHIIISMAETQDYRCGAQTVYCLDIRYRPHSAWQMSSPHLTLKILRRIKLASPSFCLCSVLDRLQNARA